jgi:hypothetical protein
LRSVASLHDQAWVILLSVVGRAFEIMDTPNKKQIADYGEILCDENNALSKSIADDIKENHMAKWFAKASAEIQAMDDAEQLPSDFYHTDEGIGSLSSHISLLRSLIPADAIELFDHAIVYAVIFGGAVEANRKIELN